MRDIRPSDSAPERSIRNIPVHHRKPLRPEPVVEEEDLPEIPADVPRRRRRRRPILRWAIVVVIVCALIGVLLSTLFAGATLSITPRSEVVTVPSVIQAALNAPIGTLSYELVSTTRSATTTVPAQGTQRVSRAASGVVTIANTYSAEPQRLIANTRFEAADGKIYRIRDSVVVPGMQGATPGTVTATIYADSPGDTYNKSGSVTFTIPGFKNDPRYTKFTATASGGISGGFVGDEPAVAQTDLTAATAALQKQLDAEVRAAASSAIPQGYSAIPGTLSVRYGQLVQTAGSNKTATLVQSATASGAIVRQNDLATAIARAQVKDYAGEAVSIDPSSQMVVQATSTTGSTLVLQMAGQVKLVWQFDPEALKQAMLGKAASEFNTVIEAFEPAIAKATLSIRPFWHNTLPTDPNKIGIKILKE